MTQPLPHSAPEQQGIPSQAVLDFIDAVESKIEHAHSFVLMRCGVVVAEGAWAPYALDNPHILYSLSKSFTSTAVGLAISEDRLSLDDPVITFYPELLPAEVSPNLAAMRVRHLLSMSTGHAENVSELMMTAPDQNWEKAFLAAPVDFPPGTHFVYDNGATYMLSSILQKTTGETVLQYLIPRLFEPLGIQNPTWEANPAGVNIGFKGLMLKTEDIARFGQMYLDKGMFQGRRILPEDWVTLATAKHVDNAGPGEDPDFIDWGQGYGFQFWRCRHNAYRGDGAFGQFCVIMPDQQAVLAVNGGMDPMQPLLNAAWEHLLPAMQPGPLPEDAGAAQKLAERLSNLAIPAPADSALEPTAVTAFERIAGKTYRLEPNYRKINTLRFTTSGDRLTLETDVFSQHYGLDRWLEGQSIAYLPYTTEMILTSGMDEAAAAALVLKAASSASWTAPDTLVLTARMVETPFVQTIICRFDGDRMTLDEKAHVSFGPLNAPQITGKMEESA